MEGKSFHYENLSTIKVSGPHVLQTVVRLVCFVYDIVIICAYLYGVILTYLWIELHDLFRFVKTYSEPIKQVKSADDVKTNAKMP